jgi:hypothetical protein
MENKKNLTTLLIIFGIVLIGGGLYLFYFSREDVSISWSLFKEETMAPVEMQQIESAKNLTQENIKNFVKTNKLDDLVNSEQYQGLVDPNIQIEIGQISNPAPFNQPPAEEETTR